MNPKPVVTTNHSENEDDCKKRKSTDVTTQEHWESPWQGRFSPRIDLVRHSYPTNLHRVISSKKTNLRFSSPPVQPQGILSDRRTASIQVLSPSAYPEVCSWGDHTVTRASWGVVNKHSCPLPFEVLVPVLRHRVGRFLEIFLAGRRKGGRKMISWSRVWSVR